MPHKGLANLRQKEQVEKPRDLSLDPAPTPVAPSPRKKATFNLDADLHRRLKVAAAMQQCEMIELVEEALRMYLQQFKLPD